MICTFCGEQFEQNKKGRKKNYCDKIECKKKANSLAQHKYHQKKQMVSKNEPLDLEEEVRLARKQYKPDEVLETKVNEEQENEVIYSEAERAEDQLALPDMSDLIDISRRFGGIRLELIEIIRKSTEGESRTTCREQELLHQIERMKSVTSEDAKKIMVELKKNREERRVFKNRRYIAKTLIDNLTMPNPPKFVQDAIKRQKEQEELEVEEKESNV